MAWKPRGRGKLGFLIHSQSLHPFHSTRFNSGNSCWSYGRYWHTLVTLSRCLHKQPGIDRDWDSFLILSLEIRITLLLEHTPLMFDSMIGMYGWKGDLPLCPIMTTSHKSSTIKPPLFDWNIQSQNDDLYMNWNIFTPCQSQVVVLR